MGVENVKIWEDRTCPLRKSACDKKCLCFTLAEYNNTKVREIETYPYCTELDVYVGPKIRSRKME